MNSPQTVPFEQVVETLLGTFSTKRKAGLHILTASLSPQALACRGVHRLQSAVAVGSIARLTSDQLALPFWTNPAGGASYGKNLVLRQFSNFH